MYGWNLSIPNTAFDFPNGWTASTSQWASAIWTEVKERPEATKGDNCWGARLNTLTSPLLYPIIFGCILWQPVCLRRMGLTSWGPNGPPQSYSQNCLWFRAFSILVNCGHSTENMQMNSWAFFVVDQTIASASAEKEFYCMEACCKWTPQDKKQQNRPADLSPFMSEVIFRCQYMPHMAISDVSGQTSAACL